MIGGNSKSGLTVTALSPICKGGKQGRKVKLIFRLICLLITHSFTCYIPVIVLNVGGAKEEEDRASLIAEKLKSHRVGGEHVLKFLSPLPLPQI